MPVWSSRCKEAAALMVTAWMHSAGVMCSLRQARVMIAAKMTIHGTKDYEISNEKARKLLGYEPKYDIEAMIDRGLAERGTAS